MEQQPKPIQKSMTVQGSILSGVSAIASLASFLFLTYQADIEKFVSDGAHIEPVHVVRVLGAVLPLLGVTGSGLAISGRVRAGGIYTPHGVPGPNKEDLIEDATNG